MATTKDQQDPKLNEPLAAYLRREADAMTDEEFEEALNKIPFQRIPGLAYTHEERIAELEIAEAEHKLGLHISSEELEEEMKTW